MINLSNTTHENARNRRYFVTLFLSTQGTSTPPISKVDRQTLSLYRPVKRRTIEASGALRVLPEIHPHPQ